MELVKVISYTPGAGILPGIVTVQPAVAQIDGQGNTTPHGNINGLPVWVPNSGGSGVLFTPSVGEIGMAVYALNDISSVKNTQALASPGSYRKFDRADGIYMGCALPVAITQYIQFLAVGGGINIVTAGPLAITASTITHNGTDIGAAHRHLYSPGTGTPIDTSTPV